MIRFAIVGTGWRSHFFLRTAAACPDRFEVTALVSRTPEKKEEFHRQYGVTLVPSLDAAIATNPLFVLTSLPQAVNPGVLHQLADRRVPILSSVYRQAVGAEREYATPSAGKGCVSSKWWRRRELNPRPKTILPRYPTCVVSL